MVKRKRAARAYAMDHLARREMSFHELVARMVKAEYPIAEAQQVVEVLRQDNLQSDVRFVEAFVSSRTRRGEGPNKIRFDLQAKRVKSDLVDCVLAQYHEQWHVIAFNALQKRFCAAQLQDLRKKQQAFQYLLRKGHDTAIIYQAFEALA